MCTVLVGCGLLALAGATAAEARTCSKVLRGTGSSDRLVGCQGVTLINGRTGGDALLGRGGRDRLRGGRNGDRLIGGPGRDKVRGNAGPDRVMARDRGRDVVSCGPGRDVARVDPRDVVRGCEVVQLACHARPAVLSLGDCPVRFNDTAATSDPVPIWGELACESATRVRHLSGGDPHATAAGAPQPDGLFRRLTVLDGDDVWGERCELGENNHQTGPTALYREGDHRITFISVRLPSGYPLGADEWQTVMQMKQAQPSANGGGAPIIEVQAKNGKWYLANDWDVLWTAPAATGIWTRFAFDVVYSPDASRGSITVYADLNGDGDAADSGERSPRFHRPTLKTESAGGWSGDGIDPGESIPSHLRAGIYHDSALSCPSPGSCAVDVDNVQVAVVR